RHRPALGRRRPRPRRNAHGVVARPLGRVQRPRPRNGIRGLPDVSGMIVAAVLLALRLADLAPSTPLGFTLAVEGTASLRVTLSGPAADLAPGPFRGTIAVNGSAAELPVAGTITHANGRWLLPFSVKYTDVPADWAERFRPDGFSYRLRS